MHLLEGRNIGFRKIWDAPDANDSPKPKFETDNDRSYFMTRWFIHEGFERAADERKPNPKMKEVLIDETKKETSFKTSLK